MAYQSKLSLIETEVAIKFIKDYFERELAKALKLTRVSAPLFVFPETGLNDNLNGYERTVRFEVKYLKKDVEIVQSLAKWKRYALGKYDFMPHTGLYTDMNAVRRDEDLDAIHSIYVDQWDWEKIILKTDRRLSYLKSTVRSIFRVLKKTAVAVNKKYPAITTNLPDDITFVTTNEAEALYPDLTPKQRENALVKKYGAVFLIGIGWDLASGKPHDGRASDYDDWNLNGDILLYNEVTDSAFEISSMGIRVDEVSLVKQVNKKGDTEKLSNPYCQAILDKKLPLTIGGGIGQSRLCMFFLKKAHIGEVQASVWAEDDVKSLAKDGIHLL